MTDDRVTLVSLCEARGITSEATHVRFEGRNLDGTIAEWPHDLWNMKVLYNGKSHVAEFRTGIGHRKPSPGVKAETRGYRHRYSGDYLPPVPAIEAQWLTFPLVDGPDGKKVRWRPSTADVLYCLASDASSTGESFDSWCSELGESNDSIKALETYRACQKTRDALLRLFGAELLEELSQAEH